VSGLRIENLHYREHGPIDLAIAPAECVSLTGPSGAGKTLLLRAVADLDPHQGRVFLDGTECADVPAPGWRRRVALLPSESQWWDDTVGPHFPEVDEVWLGMVGFARDVMGWSIARLSSGERQRLALVRALANRPEALLLDEPTANLDAANVGRVETVVAEYRRRAQAAVFWVCHDASLETRVATRHFHIADGRFLEGHGA
jgi:UDP-glucose/iron transport system ATP-binding protein